MFNWAKSKKTTKTAQSAPPSYSQMLTDQNIDRGYSLDASTPNLNGLLDAARDNSDTGEIHEANLESARKKAFDPNGNVTEGQLDNRDSYVVHRSDKNDGMPVKPMDALAEAFDQKFRKAYSEADKKGETEFWDKYIGVQMSNEKTKVSRNVPQSGSQLPSNPDRFQSMNGEATEPHAPDNFSSYTKKDKIKPMTMASLKDMDAALFHLYYEAAKAGREMTETEKLVVQAISNEKKRILAGDPTIPDNKFDPPSPLLPTKEENPAPMPPDQTGSPSLANPDVKNLPGHRDVDFLDGNPTVEAPLPGTAPKEKHEMPGALPPDMDSRYGDYERSIRPAPRSPAPVRGANFEPETPF